MASRSSTSPPGWGPGFPFMLNALCHCDWLKYSMGRPKTTYFSSYSVCKPGNRTPPRAPEASSPAAPLTMPGIRCAYVRGRVACAHKPSVRTPHTAWARQGGRTYATRLFIRLRQAKCLQKRSLVTQLRSTETWLPARHTATCSEKHPSVTCRPWNRRMCYAPQTRRSSLSAVRRQSRYT